MTTARDVLERFERLKARVVRDARIAGIYILAATEMPAAAESAAAREEFLRSFAAPFGFSGPDVGHAEWVNAVASREEARQELIHALVGGAEIGHSRWDVPPPVAEEFAVSFLDLFAEDARFFCPVSGGHAQVLGPYARPDCYDYIFGGGCVAADARVAAIFWMLDND